MAAKYYKTITVSGTIATEVLGDLLTGTSAEKKHVSRIYFTETTATLVHTATLRAYVGRERIVDFYYNHFALDNKQDDRVSAPYLDVDITLDIGETLQAGAVSAAAASDFAITAEYEVVP